MPLLQCGKVWWPIPSQTEMHSLCMYPRSNQFRSHLPNCPRPYWLMQAHSMKTNYIPSPILHPLSHYNLTNPHCYILLPFKNSPLNTWCSCWGTYALSESKYTSVFSFILFIYYFCFTVHIISIFFWNFPYSCCHSIHLKKPVTLTRHS